VHGRGAAHGGAGLGNRLHHDGGLGDAEAGAAIGLRHGDAEPAGAGERGMQLVRELAAPVLLQPVVVAEGGAELEHRLAHLLLLTAQRQIHAASPVRRTGDDALPAPRVASGCERPRALR